MPVPSPSNRYCEPLRIDVPDLAAVRDHPEANAYSLLIVALLERGEPMTLREVAMRFESAGFEPFAWAIERLKKCKPARAPVYRDGDRYGLDVHDAGLSLWAFRLGLRPPAIARPALVRRGPRLAPGPEEPLTAGELDEAFKDASLAGWSAQRLALAVLDAHGTAMDPADVVAAVDARTRDHLLQADARQFRRSGSAIGLRADGRWEIQDPQAMAGARTAVRTLVARARERAATQPDPAAIAAHQRLLEQRRAAHAAELASLRRAIVHAYPARDPLWVVVLDAGGRGIHTWHASAFDDARAHLAAFDVVAAIDVRNALRSLGVDPEGRRVCELGPPQKTRQLNRSGRTLRITSTLLVNGSCGISRPFGDPRRLAEYLARGETTKLRRRLEADAKSLFALYEYGRLHHCVRLRWGFLDERLPVPWVHHDEDSLYTMMGRALAEDRVLEVVVGSAPGWSDPWARSRRCCVEEPQHSYRRRLVDELGLPVDEFEVQAARLGPPR